MEEEITTSAFAMFFRGPSLKIDRKRESYISDTNWNNILEK